MSQNAVFVLLPLRLRMCIQKDCAKNEQLPATVILRILTEHFKDEIPQEEFDALIYQYSLTAFEQQREKRRKAEQQQKAEQPKQDARERKLREEINLCEIRIRDPNTAKVNYWERRKRQAEDKLKAYLETRAKLSQLQEPQL